MKKCSKCKIEKELNNFIKDKNRKDGLYPVCDSCRKSIYEINKNKILNQKQLYYEENKSVLIQKRLNYYNENLELIKQQRINRHKRTPWKFTLYAIKSRCNNPKDTSYKDYGGRGIQCLITEAELKILWIRDNANTMDSPSIDRQDNDGNYTFKNCRYVEFGINSAERNKRVSSKSVLQLDKNKNIIKEWNSLTEAAKCFNVSVSAIFNAIHHKRNTYFCKGFLWRYKND
jgi:hypothetical protein